MARAAWLVSLLVPSGLNAAPDENLPDLAERALKSVVLVVTSGADGRLLRQASGFFADKDGRLVTNYHVIEGASSAIIKRPDGAFFVVEGVIAYSAENDLAILKVVGKGFTPLPLGDSDKVKVGESVAAVGSPLALEATVSNGIISGLRLERDEVHLLQTTAPISHGSSGGALLNMRGEVVGVTTLQIGAGQNLNFAIPVNRVRHLLEATGKAVPFEELQRPGLRSAPHEALPKAWLEMQNSMQWNVRVAGDFLYEEAMLPDVIRRDGGFILCESKLLEGRYVGVCRERLPFWCNQRRIWCTVEVKHFVNSLTPHRIEGETRLLRFREPRLSDVRRSRVGPPCAIFSHPQRLTSRSAGTNV